MATLGPAPIHVLPMLEKEIPAVAPAAPSRTEAPSPEMAPTDMPVAPLFDHRGGVARAGTMEPIVTPDQSVVLT